MPPSTGPSVVGRIRRDLSAGVTIAKLVVRNLTSDQPVVDTNGPDQLAVSLTSHGDRLKHVHLAVESIGRGRRRPSLLTLWVNDAEFLDHPGRPLERLVARGLQIKLAENYGPHTKYYPHALSQAGGASPTVICDDDTLYPVGWLDELYNTHLDNPDHIVCHRAHRVTVTQNRVSSYAEWPECGSAEPRLDNFATGVSGVLYPGYVMSQVLDAGLAFQQHAPKADDVWLHSLAVENAVLTRQVTDDARLFPVVPGSQRNGLQVHNTIYSQNDHQIQASYSSRAIELLDSSGAEDERG